MKNKRKNFRNNSDKIKIPLEFAERIDKIIGTGMTIYPSREEFVKSAIMMKMSELKGNKRL